MLARAWAKADQSNRSPGSATAELSGPVRTCLGCRTRDEATELLRVVFNDGGVIPDPRRRSAGRGAYLHPRRSCFDQAEKRRAFARALRLEQSQVDTTQVLAHLLVVEQENADGTTTRGAAGKEGSRSDPS